MNTHNTRKWMAIAACAASITMVGVTTGTDAPRVRTIMTREERLIATSAVLVDEFTTNATRMAKLMLPDAKREWVSFCQSMIVDGKQYFLPDFLKVKYTFIGGSDTDSYVLGVYSPFYDSFMLMRVCDGGKIPQIVAFRVATVSRLKESQTFSAFPPSAGCKPADAYITALTMQVRRAGEAFHSRFLGKEAPAAIKALATSPDAERSSLQTLHKARLGLLANVASEATVKAKVILADLVVRDGRFSSKQYISKDASTKKVLDALAKLPVAARNAAQMVSYFEADGSSNVLYMIPVLPTMLMQANIKDGNIWLKMFDARLANGKTQGVK